MGDSPSKLTGTQWHVGYLKMKPGDHKHHKKHCIYYGDDNSCASKFSHCIGSSHCKYYKEKPKETSKKKTEASKSSKPPKPKFLESIPCSIPLASYVETKDGKMGVFVKYKNKSMTLLVKGKEVGYVYPDAFQDGYLKTTPEIDAYIKKDLLKAVWK